MSETTKFVDCPREDETIQIRNGVPGVAAIAACARGRRLAVRTVEARTFWGETLRRTTVDRASAIRSRARFRAIFYYARHYAPYMPIIESDQSKIIF